MIKENPEFLEIIIPCFNEGLAIKDLVEKCNSVSSQAPIHFILVDNGSTDDTWQQLKNLTLENTNITPIKIANNIGYGHGILSGLRTTKAPYVGWIHADLQTNPEELIQIVNWLNLESSSVNIFIKGRRRNRELIDVFFHSLCQLLKLFFSKKKW